MSAVSDLIARRLVDAGVRTVFGVPGGGGNLDLIESAGRVGLPFVLTSTEAGAAIASTAQAEVAGRPGACLATIGPGAASLTNGVACAHLDRAPLVVLTDCHPLAAGGTYIHQQLDHRALFAPIAKWSGCLTQESAGRTIDEAFAAVLTEPPGPVHLDCPADVTDVRERQTAPRAGPRAAPPDGESLERLADLVGASRKPLLIVGLGARRPDDAAAIRALCDRRGLPALVTYKAKGVVPDAHPAYAGVFTNAAIERPIVESCDLIIGVGLDPVELLPRPWTFGQPVVYVGRWPVASGHVPFRLQVIADVAVGASAIGDALSAAAWDAEAAGASRRRQRLMADACGGALTAEDVVEIAAERLAPHARVTVDAGAHMLPATLRWPVAEPGGLLISNGLSTMGFALPAAVGAALADRGRPVVALTGDGGLLMCAGELLTAVRERLRIITVVFSDASLSLIEIKQRQRGRRGAATGLGSINWRALADAFGAAAWAAADEASLRDALDGAAAWAGPSLIEARIDPSTYGRLLRIVRG
jgi:acetolactate synthase-1/2/3 large subunit